MLVLSRREEQTITFPDLGITIQVLRTGGHQVRIGIDAPRSVRVLRGELEDTANHRGPMEAAEMV